MGYDTGLTAGAGILEGIQNGLLLGHNMKEKDKDREERKQLFDIQKQNLRLQQLSAQQKLQRTKLADKLFEAFAPGLMQGTQQATQDTIQDPPMRETDKSGLVQQIAQG